MGGLKPGTRRTWLRVAAARKQIEAPASPTRGRHLAPGARLLREWHGRTYRVDVLDSGFEHEGGHYRSLSEVARAITGAWWSGSRFFGP